MARASKIVLVWKSGDDETLLGPFVEDCLRDGVKFVGVVGPNCERIHDLIDEYVVDDGSDASRFILTSWHADETVDEALEFARMLTGAYAGQVEVMEL